jgi:ectoine hydroxylase-related dioxygenase (phytanoyl-CoA dioxygenase family)
MVIEMDLKTAIDLDGFAVIENVLSRGEIVDLLRALEQVPDASSLRKRSAIFAMRNLLDIVPEVRKLACSPKVNDLLKPILGEHFFPVRGILFDKIPDANWKVPWHQDVTIAVQTRTEAEGFGPWSMKAEVLHVQPPAPILESMISVRFHMDDCRADNGALRTIPGSHRFGRIPESEISAFRAKSSERICEVDSGGVLLMRPLLLHASSPALVPDHRRVIHIDFASAHLPAGMHWLYEPVARRN